MVFNPLMTATVSLILVLEFDEAALTFAQSITYLNGIKDVA